MLLWQHARDDRVQSVPSDRRRVSGRKRLRRRLGRPSRGVLLTASLWAEFRMRGLAALYLRRSANLRADWALLPLDRCVDQRHPRAGSTTRHFRPLKLSGVASSSTLPARGPVSQSARTQPLRLAFFWHHGFVADAPQAPLPSADLVETTRGLHRVGAILGWGLLLLPPVRALADRGGAAWFGAALFGAVALCVWGVAARAQGWLCTRYVSSRAPRKGRSIRLRRSSRFPPGATKGRRLSQGTARPVTRARSRVVRGRRVAAEAREACKRPRPRSTEHADGSAR